jgi:phenylpyruvate tautomerase PptA (4-oxalocrotonate tautomerase family)
MCSSGKRRDEYFFIYPSLNVKYSVHVLYNGEKNVPTITITTSTLTQEKREALIKELTEAAHKIMPEVPKNAFYVYVRDYPPENIGIGGLVLPKYMKSLES